MKFDILKTATNFTVWRNTCEFIVLHHTGALGFENQTKYLSGPNSRKVSVHYVVGEKWEVAKIWEDTQILHHAGISTRAGRTDMNRYSIGIEIVSLGTTFTTEQKAKVKELVSYLMEKHGIPFQNIIRHKDIAPARKTDVWDGFWNKEYKTFDAWKKQFAPSDAEEQAKQAQASKVIYEIKALYELTKSPNNKDFLHSTAEKLREIYGVS